MRADTDEYARRGASWVGTQALTISGETPLEISVWYPAANAAGPEETTTYPYTLKMGDPLGKVTIASYTGQAIPGGAYDLSHGPYPLVILSPGFAIGSSAYAWLAEHLASHGLVVISPDHAERLDPENELWRATVTRPQDVLTVLAFVDEQAGPGGQLEGLVTSDRVAVIGHSYGGYTALAAGGAQLDTQAFADQCEAAYQAGEPNPFLCDMLQPHWADMAALAGLDAVPTGRWPAWADSRIDAVVSIAGDAVMFGPAGLAGVNVPVLAIGGTADDDSPYEWGTSPAYQNTTGPRKVRIGLEGAGHMLFTGPCEPVRWYLKPLSAEFCSDAGWDRGYAHDLVRHFTTAFLLAELKHDPAATAGLAPERVSFTGVTYNAQGYTGDGNGQGF
ncbi:MAG: hypothetical protein GYA17_03730 [Chloroflexi bacterium]|nr:hypothetical protein [Chloroflexota bacterium]